MQTFDFLYFNKVFHIRRCYRRPESDCTIEKKPTRGVLRSTPNFLAMIANGCKNFRKKLHLGCLTSFSYVSGVKHRSVTNRGSTKLVFYNCGQNPQKYLRKSQFCCKVACCRSAVLLEIQSLTDIFQGF